MNRWLNVKIVLVFFITVCFTSCFTSKPVQYFGGVLDTTAIQSMTIPVPVIQAGDLLSITVYSDNPEATALFNQAGSATVPAQSSLSMSKSLPAASTASGSNAGYLVDRDGYIRMHAIGMIKAAGLTKEQLMDTVILRLKGQNVLSNPYAVVRFSNFRVTVLGEVRNPGVFNISSEKASVLEALGLAGDISDYGLKKNLLLIREADGKRTFHSLDLTNPGIFTSELFYLRQNDVVVVQPDSRKPTAVDQKNLQYITVGAAVISSIAIFLTLFR